MRSLLFKKHILFFGITPTYLGVLEKNTVKVTWNQNKIVRFPYGHPLFWQMRQAAVLCKNITHNFQEEQIVCISIERFLFHHIWHLTKTY